MQIALFSDLHIEFNPNLILDASAADLVVLAGDIGPVEDSLALAAQLADKHGIPVIFVPGNHEYYGQDIEELNQSLRNWHEPSGLVHVLIERAVVLKGVRFIGTTLWTDFRLHGEAGAAMAENAAKSFLPDFKQIRRGGQPLAVTDLKELYQQARHFLEQELAASAEPCVVITHFGPEGPCCAPQFAKSPLTPYFINNCTDLIERYQPRYWMFGHTHHSVDYQHGDTRVVSNQHGYPHEVNRSSGFSMEKRFHL